MELRRYVQLLRHRIAFLGLAVAVGLAGGYLSVDRTRIFQAQALVYVQSRQFAAIADSPNAPAAMDRLVGTFAALVKSDEVAAAALQRTNVARTQSQVVAATSTAVLSNTNSIGVFVTDADPAIAQALANGVAQSFVALVEGLESGTGSGSGPGAPISVFQPAGPPRAPLPTAPTKRRMALGGLVGLTSGLAVAALLNYLDITVKNPEDLERAAGVPVLGSIPVLRGSSSSARMVAHPSPTAPSLAE